VQTKDRSPKSAPAVFRFRSYL